jgi:hypothetical protein
MKRPKLLLLSFVAVCLALSAKAATDAALQNAQDRLREQFDRWLQEPNDYQKRAVAECSVFPEGEIYPFALPALGYCNLVRSDSRLKTAAGNNVPKLIELLIPATVRRVRPPGGDLMQLAAYDRQGTFLATLNIVLGSYTQIAPNNKYKALHAHISRLLYRAMEDLGGMPLESYPEYTWYFDSIMALVSLRLFEDANGLPRRSDSLLQKHLQWRDRHASDKATDLPIAYKGGLPRGCDLSMQICLLANLDQEAARKLYTGYVNHHWTDYGVVAGFTEWPKGRGLLMTGDIDSGPLFLGIGMTATGVGLGSALVMKDFEKVSRLAGQLGTLPTLVRSLSGPQVSTTSLFDGAVPVNPDYLTGFLYGDAVLFYAVTCNPVAPGRLKQP